MEGTLDISLEQVWADLEEALGDDMPPKVYPEDTTWFTLTDYQRRYGQGAKHARAFLDEQVELGRLERQSQRRKSHNVVCYKPIKKGEE